MKLRDIVNRDLVTLTNCESEPIHIPGAIQPHGFLLAILPADRFRIQFCSGNSEDYCGIPYGQLLGRTFEEAFSAGEEAKLVGYLDSDDFAAGNPVALHLGEVSYSCTVRLVDGLYLVEAEPFPDGFRNLPDLYRQTAKFVAHLGQTQTLAALCQTIAEETRSITGYDRVMIYRFDADYNGEVIAEAKRDDLEPFLHLHYPHTDIPAQARELYLRNLLRFIVDVRYEPVPIFTIDDGSARNLDLSHSVLRSVSPIHIEYLKNMGVGATLTISLIHERKLWGLISCHHYAPKNLPHYTRLSALLQGHFLTSQISVRELSEAFEAGKGISSALERLLRHTSGLGEDSLKELVLRPELLQIARASGVAILFNGAVYGNGLVPDHAELDAIARRLHDLNKGDTYATTMLREVYPEAGAPGFPAAGLLFHSLSADGRHFIMWFRPEQVTEVLWAGDPAKAIVKDENGLSPRKSFEKWTEQTRHQSNAWTEAEIVAASNFVHALQRQLSLIILGAEEQRYRKLSEQLQQANSELEDINWISTHDLQEPLRKIQVFASRALDPEAGEPDSAALLQAVQRMSDAANRMQALVTDIHAFSKINHGTLLLRPASLEQALDDVLASLTGELEESGAVIVRGPLPVVAGEAFLLRQLFSNIIGNALKFARSGVPPRIAFHMSKAPYDGPEAQAGEIFHKVSVSDNGIGFNTEHAAQIFGLFRRLHSQKSYGGTGIGLAICRKIMQRHNGHITAEGRAGEGAVFNLWFPVDEPGKAVS